MGRQHVRVGIAAAAMGLAAGAAAAASIQVTVTNTGPVGGFSLTPVYIAFHDGSFDAFDLGAAASPGVELVAETGLVEDIEPERMAADPASGAQAIGAPGGFAGAPVVEPGESASARFDLDPTRNRYLSFLSMILPSNDTFIGADDPLAYEIFDSRGAFLGPKTIEITGALINDAGTEVNDPALGPAFTVGADILLGAVEGSVVTPGQSLLDFAGMTLPNGQVLGAGAIDYTAAPGAFRVATIEVSQVPVPPALGLLAGALGLLGVGRTFRKSAST